MARKAMRYGMLVGLVAALLMGWSVFREEPACEAKVSSFGRYCGYAEERFDGYARSSHYVDLPNGARLAVDVLMPTRDGIATQEKLPVLFQHTIYSRAMALVRNGDIADAEMLKLTFLARAWLWLSASFSGGTLVGDQAMARPWIERMIKQGYVVVAADASGAGASYGAPLRSFQDYGHEAGLVIDWIVAQPWSNGRVGMFGQSFTAMIALAAAAQGNPALKAVYGASVSLDSYRAVGYRGGIRDIGFGDSYVRLTSQLDDLAVPVDSDENGAEMARAQMQRRPATFSALMAQLGRQVPLVDAPSPPGGLTWEDVSLYPLLPRLREGRVPIYLEAGWLDIFTRDTLITYANLAGPRRLLVRPWHHRVLTQAGDDLDPGAEAQRWLDSWLRDIDTSIGAEPEVHYVLVEPDGTHAWHEAASWPIASAVPRRFDLAAESHLTERADSDELPSGIDASEVNLSATSGIDSRWNGVLGEGRYGDMAANDAKGLAYTTAPLDAALILVGHPIVQIWAAAENSDDLDIIVYLEDVAPDGSVAYVTEGALRGSHRAMGAVAYDALGLPIHAHTRASIAKLRPGVPVALAFDLQPAAHRFGTGHRLRLTVQAADADNLAHDRDNPYRIAIHRGGSTPSSILLPVIGE